MNSRSRLAPLLLLALAGCSYHVGDLYAIQSVRLSIFDNDDERRTHEFDLSLVVARELSSAGIRVNGQDAPYELVGTIENFREPARVQTGQDEVIVSAVSIQLRILIREIKTGKVIVDGRRVETATFAPLRGQTRETARQAVFDKLARWVLTKFEKEW